MKNRTLGADNATVSKLQLLQKHFGGVMCSLDAHPTKQAGLGSIPPPEFVHGGRWFLAASHFTTQCLRQGSAMHAKCFQLVIIEKKNHSATSAGQARVKKTRTYNIQLCV